LYCVGRIGTLHIRSAIEEIRDGKGKLVREAQPAVRVVFQYGGIIPDHAKEKALEKLDFVGLPEDADPLRSVTWFDSKIAASENKWDDDDLAMVEQVLRERDGNGFVIVEQPTVEAPFPNWVKQTTVHGQRRLEHVVANALRFVEEMGLNPDSVIAFERAAGRPESEAIIGALQPVVERDQAEIVVA
jgi:hypothetical protein